MIGQFVMRGLWLHDGTIGHEWGMGNCDTRGQLVMITPSDQLSPHVIITPLLSRLYPYIMITLVMSLPSKCHGYLPLCHNYPTHVTITLGG